MNNSHPTIGYFTSGIGESVSQAIWSGVVGAARELGVNLICFAGEGLCDAAGPPSPSNVAYDLASLKALDGLVIWTSAIAGSLSHDKTVNFCRRYWPLPMVSITRPLAGIPTVLIDSYLGMRDIIAHLIEFHGYRRLAFIQGPAGHCYAQERYHAYTDALEAYDIPFDPRLVTTPDDYVVSTGVKGVQLLLDERNLRPGVDFEVIVTASDLFALGAMDELRKRDTRVPEDVALVGFNDRIEGRFAIPSFTSVKLPFYEQGHRAVELLLALLAGEQVPDQVILPAKLKIRQSCGCLPPVVTQAAAWPLHTSPHFEKSKPFDAALAARRDVIITEMVQAAETAVEGLSPGWAEKLLETFAAEVAGASDKEGGFLRELDHLLYQIVSEGNRVGDWQNVVSALRRHTLPCFSKTDVDKLLRAQDLCGQARVLIGETAQRARGHQMMQVASRTLTLRQVSKALVSAFDVKELGNVLARDLPKLGIESCYLAVYENPQEPTGLSRLILAFDKLGRADLKIDERTFPSDQLIPPELIDRRRSGRTCGLMLEPLCFQEERIGFVLFGIGPRDGTIYETLRDQISGSLKGALLFDEIRKAQSDAEQARVVAEKADSLKTRLLANVSHELRTPLNVIIGCTREAMNSPESYGTVLPDALRDDLVHIRRSAEHQLRVINDLLDLSRAEIDELDLYPEIMDPLPLLQEAFYSMMDANTRDGVTWHLKLPERLPKIQADPVRLRQILLNLLSNASKYVERGEVILGAVVAPPHLHIWIQDTGPGIPLYMQERIFEPFVTAGHTNRRLEGAGLGLSITRRLVALHRGSIKLESQPGQGSTFHVYLPLPTLDNRPFTCSVKSRRVLLLISSHNRPPAEIVEFSRRQELEICNLQAGDDLDIVVQREQPAALAWDMTNARTDDWAIIRRLRNHPRVSQTPFILYGHKAGKEATLSVGMTNFVTKPTNSDTLMDAINGVCPPKSLGPILIVDDDPQVLDLYRQVVAEGCPGYSVRTANDGAAAVSLMSAETPSLVILDLMMPEMDGFDVLDWMRESDQTRQVPVVILSSRLLSLDDVKRIERHMLVTLQSKGILAKDEEIVALSRVLFGTDMLPQHTSALVKRAVVYLHQNYRHTLSRFNIAEALNVSEDYFSRIFRQEMNLSPWEYLNRYRILRAKELLRSTGDGVKNVAFRVGFSNPAYFSRMFRKVTGTSPSAYREYPE